MIHFTADDLARTQLRPTLGPLSEAVFAIGLLQQRGGRVHHHLRDRLARSRQGARLAAACPPVDDLGPEQLHQVVTGATGGRGAQGERVALGARTLWGAAIAPHWRRISNHLTAEADWRGRVAVRDGVERLLSALHPRATWDGTVLSVEGCPPGELHLGGRGVIVAPSVFLAPRPAAALDPGAGTGTPALVFATPPAAGARLLEPVRATEPAALGALVGQTRAAVLRELVDPCFNNELAVRLGISSASASQHAAVLRQSGLISTRRVRNHVLHSVTPLGRALLGQESDGAVALLV
ncbi:helix-turn-helix domain-containing protein [Actinokineospora bangkokensis]|uniref:HTH arsR-type domain-containing protein n=1 Tax=Actinokineospora bangkokensis TaxID=1193682 RepID=A0A1Q9LIR6_9PSEU|nr:helix-turn-helix domain-containing protein [Actinokineospora bangkokensis]OLR91941.1 hypothetical protein BJP25_24245 [Actinokineospora bangkokensis]